MTENRASALESTRGCLRRLKIARTLVHKQQKLDRSFYQPSVFCSVSSPLHTL